jgi:hypothetical protein
MSKKINRFGDWNDAINKLGNIRRQSKDERNEQINIHKEGLLKLYEQQLEESGEFMNIVLKEAIRKLKETNIEPIRIEDWVVNLDKNWRNI